MFQTVHTQYAESREPVLSIGERVGPYTITGFIGAGGMGEVYEAHDTNLNRTVALKLLPSAVANDRDPACDGTESPP